MSFPVTVVDQNGNAMPAGTTVAFSTTNGIITSATSYVVGDTIACRIGINPNTITVANPLGVPYDCPAWIGSTGFGDSIVTMRGDAALVDTLNPITGVTTTACSNANGSSGTFTVTVTTPSGKVTPGGVVRVTD